jgi:phosphoribosyl-AMP cyclohydrolase
MVYFQSKNPNLGIFWTALELKIFYVKSIHFWPFGIICGHLVYISTILVYCTKKTLATRLQTQIYFCSHETRKRFGASEVRPE